MRRQILLASAASLLLAVPGLAQQPQPGSTASPGRTQSGSATPGNAQRLSAAEFVRMVQMSDRHEIASSRLAQNQAQHDQVKQLAAEMVRDHTRTMQELMEVTQRAGLQVSGMMPQGSGSASSSARAGAPGAPTTSGSTGGAGMSSTQGAGQGAAATAAQGGMAMEGLDAEHQQMIQRLQGLRGAEFDRMYIQQQVQAHQKAVDLFTAYSQNGDQAELKQWAARTLPALQQHLQRAQQLQRTVQG